MVFPGMTVTLTVDTGDETRVLLVPRHEQEYAKVGTVAEVAETVRLPGGARAVALSGLHRAVIGAAKTDPQGQLRVEVEERPDENPPPVQTRELEREYRAVVEEILDIRDADDRIRQFLRSISDAGHARRHLRVLPRHQLRPARRAARGRRRRRAARARTRAPARAARRAAGAAAHPRRRRVGRAEAAARVVPAQADGLDPQGARRGRGLRRRGVPDEDRRGRDAGRRPRPGRARAAPARDDGRLLGRGFDDPHVPRLADLGAVVEALRRAARPRERARGARRRPRGPRRREGPDRRVPGGAQAPAGPRPPERQAERRDPDADRPARHRQDVDRRVGRARAQPRVRPHVARRHPRRGGDPRPPAHVHRRAAGAARPRPARREDDEPGDPARRGRQGRRRLARRPVGRPARGARPGAEPLVPRPLPRRRARPLRGVLHRHRQRRRHDPRPAARPDGGHPLRRLHDRREDGDRTRLPLAEAARAERAARGRGLDRGRRDQARRLRLHAGGRRPPARAGARQDPAQDRDEDRLRGGRAAGRPSTSTSSATRSAARSSSRRRRIGRPYRAWRRGSP